MVGRGGGAVERLGGSPDGLEVVGARCRARVGGLGWLAVGLVGLAGMSSGHLLTVRAVGLVAFGLWWGVSVPLLSCVRSVSCLCRIIWARWCVVRGVVVGVVT